MSDFRCDAIYYMPPASCCWPNCACSAVAEIYRLQELLRGTGANRYWEGRWRDADAVLARLRRILLALTDAAEHDMKMNQGGDNHEGEPEGSGGWWSSATENAIREARAALRSATEKDEPT